LYYHCLDTDEAEKLARQMLLVVVHVLDTSAKDYKLNYNHPAWNNITDYLHTVHQFIFFSPTPIKTSSSNNDPESSTPLKIKPSPTRPLVTKGKAMKMHIGPKGCRDSPIVADLVKLLCETIKVHKMEPTLEPDKEMLQLQLQLKARLEIEADFFRQLHLFFSNVPHFGGVNPAARKQVETVLEAASKRENPIPSQDLEDALLGLLHVVSMSMVTPNMNRRRGASGANQGIRTRPKRAESFGTESLVVSSLSKNKSSSFTGVIPGATPLSAFSTPPKKSSSTEILSGSPLSEETEKPKPRQPSYPRQKVEKT